MLFHFLLKKRHKISDESSDGQLYRTPIGETRARQDVRTAMNLFLFRFAVLRRQRNAQHFRKRKRVEKIL